jgi:hypothetical protein
MTEQHGARVPRRSRLAFGQVAIGQTGAELTHGDREIHPSIWADTKSRIDTSPCDAPQIKPIALDVEGTKNSIALM